jgi:MFS family permease
MAGAATAPTEIGESRTQMWTSTFVLLCAAQALGFAQNGLLTPILPLYLSSIGSTELTIGLVLAAFSLTSFLARPFLGSLADAWSVAGVLRVGGLLLGCACAGLGLPTAGGVALANAVRGLGWSCLNTGGYTMLAHVAPDQRRAESASYLSLAQNAPLALAPPLAVWLLDNQRVGGFDTVFLVAGGAALAGALLALAVRIPRSPRPSVSADVVGPSRPPLLARLIDVRVFLPSMLLFCLSLVQPVTSAFVPLYARSLGIEVSAVSWYYLANGLAVVLGQAALGRVGDRLGRARSLGAGYTISIAGLGLLLVASNLVLLLAGGIVFAIGSALVLPSSMALAIDRANPHRRGTAMATYSMWFQVGNGVGSAAAGLTAELFGLRAMYLLALGPPLIGLLIVAQRWARLTPRPG